MERETPRRRRKKRKSKRRMKKLTPNNVQEKVEYNQEGENKKTKIKEKSRNEIPKREGQRKGGVGMGVE